MRTTNPLAALRAIQAGDDAPASDSPRESPVGRESLAGAQAGQPHPSIDDELGYPGVLSLGIPRLESDHDAVFVKVQRQTASGE